VPLLDSRGSEQTHVEMNLDTARWKRAPRGWESYRRRCVLYVGREASQKAGLPARLPAPRMEW